MAREYQLLGPPGTGKTSTLAKRVAQFVDAGEYEPRDIMLTSFTRSAAAVLAGRVNVPRENISTLHAIAYRALGSPELAEAGNLAKEWNEQKIPSSWRIGGKVADLDDGLAPPEDGVGEMLRMYSLARARMVPEGHTLRVRSSDFARAWEDWKRAHDAYDFTDLLQEAFYAFDNLPGGQPVLIADEAQDFVPLQWTVLRHWAETCDRFIVAGDPAQLLYHFAGARPENMSQGNIEDSYTLPRSYRLPAAVQAHAERWLKSHSTPLSLEYAPREEQGEVRQIAATWRYPEQIVDLIEEESAGKASVLVLASCAYMLNPLIAQLRERGIPFHNPYRRSNGRWNPLGSASRFADEGKVSTASRVQAFAEGRALGWPAMLAGKHFALRGGKKRVAEAADEEDAAVLAREWLGLEAQQAWDAGDVKWLASAVTKEYVRPVSYAASIIATGGPETLREQPRVIPSTIHAAKGGEADTVIVFPDVSQAGYNEITAGTEGRDAAVRMGYVALTRARERLLLASPSGHQALW